MEQYQIRLMLESSQLNEKIVKLENMLNMSDEERGFSFKCPERLLQSQLDVMKRYSSILDERIRIEIPEELRK